MLCCLDWTPSGANSFLFLYSPIANTHSFSAELLFFRQFITCEESIRAECRGFNGAFNGAVSPTCSGSSEGAQQEQHQVGRLINWLINWLTALPPLSLLWLTARTDLHRHHCRCHHYRLIITTAAPGRFLFEAGFHEIYIKKFKPNFIYKVTTNVFRLITPGAALDHNHNNTLVSAAETLFSLFFIIKYYYNYFYFKWVEHSLYWYCRTLCTLIPCLRKEVNMAAVWTLEGSATLNQHQT